MKALSVVNERTSPDHVRREAAKPRFGDVARPFTELDADTPAGALQRAVVEKIKEVFDPEIPVNVFELGLIYGVEVQDDARVHVRMTLTAPNCPVAQSLPEQVRQKAAEAEGVAAATVEVVWSPPWNPGMMSEAARLETNLF